MSEAAANLSPEFGLSELTGAIDSAQTTVLWQMSRLGCTPEKLASAHRFLEQVGWRFMSEPDKELEINPGIDDTWLGVGGTEVVNNYQLILASFEHSGRLPLNQCWLDQLRHDTLRAKFMGTMARAACGVSPEHLTPAEQKFHIFDFFEEFLLIHPSQQLGPNRRRIAIISQRLAEGFGMMELYAALVRLDIPEPRAAIANFINQAREHDALGVRVCIGNPLPPSVLREMLMVQKLESET